MLKIFLQIPLSYNIWRPTFMIDIMCSVAYAEYDTEDYNTILNRSTPSLVIEWWIHNIGYYLTRPLIIFPKIKEINTRFRDVDLERWD